VIVPSLCRDASVRSRLLESRSLGVERKLGGNLHPWLNINERSIANKYREGKLKSTSKGELKYLKSLRGKRLSVTHVWRLVFRLLDITSTVLDLLLLCFGKARGPSCTIGVTPTGFAISCQERHVQATRLETRTKEFNNCASVRVSNSYAQ
jgi:hypothetical protein